MRVILFAALAVLNSVALAQSAAIDSIPASDLSPYCGLVANPPAQIDPANQILVDRLNESYTGCAMALGMWLSNTHRSPPPADVAGNTAQLRCAARLILNHAHESRAIGDILAAEFDKACGEPTTM